MSNNACLNVTEKNNKVLVADLVKKVIL
ncbi:rCG28367 [Rattus norvegicus]|uniref:RCG28367 n=1 Tax=Rattus norvegicus TaxID=10116 RepID=A6IF90_RAT|nr:rCG28367 [Rattus norvegicus]